MLDLAPPLKVERWMDRVNQLMLQLVVYSRVPYVGVILGSISETVFLLSIRPPIRPNNQWFNKIICVLFEKATLKLIK